jgi:hypothetical protein
MSTNSDSPNNGGGNRFVNLLKAIGNAILMVFVTPIMILNELRRELSKDVYSGWEGGCRAAIGALLGLAAAGSTGHYLGWVLEWHTAAWVGSGVLAWFATYCYAWPLFYLFPVKPAFKGAELAWDAIREVSKKYADKVFGGLVRSISSVLPGSGSAWTKVLGEKKDSWVGKATVGLSYPITLAGSAYAGYLVYGSVTGYVGAGILGITCGVGAGLLAGLTIAGAIWNFIDEGKLPFVAFALGFGVDRVFNPEISGISSLVHLNGYLSLIGHAVAVLAFVFYVFPLVYLALSGGLIKYLVEKLKPLNERAYDDRDKDYTEFFHNAATLAVTGIAVWQGFVWGSAIGLPVWGLIPALAIVASFAYLWVFDVVDHGGGTFFTGLAASAYSGWFVGSHYLGAALPGGVWMAYPVGIVSALVMGAVLFPAAYLVVKPIFVLTRISKLGKPLSRLHKAIEDGFHRLTQELMRVYDNSYRDRSGYQTWFLHAANIAVTALVALHTPGFLSWAHGHVPSILAFMVPVSAVAVLVSQVVLGTLSYILVGKFLQKSNVGIEFIGGLSSLALATWLCSHTLAVNASIWATMLVGVIGWVAGMALLFPIAYIAFRFPAKFLLASWTSTILVKVHAFAWSAFLVVWNQIVAVYKIVDTAIFVPVRNMIAAASHRVSDAYEWVRSKILRRK